MDTYDPYNFDSHHPTPYQISPPIASYNQVGNFKIEGPLSYHQLVQEHLVRNTIDGALYLMKVYERHAMEMYPFLSSVVAWEQSVLLRTESPYVIQLHTGLQNEDGSVTFNFFNRFHTDTIGDIIMKSGPISEHVAYEWLRQIVRGLDDINRIGYLARILTNSSFRVEGNNTYIDIYGDDRNRLVIMGLEPNFYSTEAPEIFENGGLKDFHDPALEVWSLGVCFYCMLFGIYPWEVTSDVGRFLETIKNRSGMNLAFPIEPRVSDDIMVMLQAMIEPNPSLRISWRDLCIRLKIGGELFNNTKSNSSLFAPPLLFHYNVNDISFTKDRPEDIGLNDSFSVNLKEANHSLFSSMINVQTLVHRESIRNTIHHIDDPDDINENVKINMLKAVKPISMVIVPTDDTVPNKPPASSIFRASGIKTISGQQPLSGENNQPTGPTKAKLASSNHSHNDNSLICSNTSFYTDTHNKSYCFNTKSRYKHELKICYFAIETIETIEGLVSIMQNTMGKDPYYQSFLVMSYLISIMNVDRCNNLIHSINSNINIFNMHDFDQFVSSEYTRSILKDMNVDLKQYKDISEGTLQTMRSIEKKIPILSDMIQYGEKGERQPSIKDYMKITFYRICSYYIDKNKPWDRSLCYTIQQEIGRLYMNVYADEEFEFERGGKLFDWKQLESFMDQSYLTQTYDLAFRHFLKTKSTSDYTPLMFVPT